MGILCGITKSIVCIAMMMVLFCSNNLTPTDRFLIDYSGFKVGNSWTYTIVYGYTSGSIAHGGDSTILTRTIVGNKGTAWYLNCSASYYSLGQYFLNHIDDSIDLIPHDTTYCDTCIIDHDSIHCTQFAWLSLLTNSAKTQIEDFNAEGTDYSSVILPAEAFGSISFIEGVGIVKVFNNNGSTNSFWWSRTTKLVKFNGNENHLAEYLPDFFSQWKQSDGNTAKASPSSGN